VFNNNSLELDLPVRMQHSLLRQVAHKLIFISEIIYPSDTWYVAGISDVTETTYRKIFSKISFTRPIKYLIFKVQF
jgi:hypothetical protein